MEVDLATRIVAWAGLALISLLGTLQLVAVLRPRARWTLEHVYGGDPASTDEAAYFAFNQGWAWADAVFWAPLQVAGSAGMLMGARWGFLLALVASVPFWYSAIPIFFWDRAMGIRRPTVGYWLFTWGVFPVFGVVEGIYCFARLLA